METMRVKFTFIDEVLGTKPGDPEIHENFIASKAPDAATMAEEIENFGIEAVTEKGKTFFDRDQDGNVFFYNYQIKGFFKAACGAIRRIPGTESAKAKAYKKIIDTNVFVFADAENKQERRIRINVNGELGNCQRPLRAQTMQGERVALADSETVPAGSSIEFDILLMDKSLEPLVCEWLDYGVYNGLGQWRNSGKGAFTWERVN